MYKRIDDRYIKPWMLRENHSIKDPKIIETYENLTERDVLEFRKRNPTQFAELAGSRTFTELNKLNGGESSAKASATNLTSAATEIPEVDPQNMAYKQTQEDLDETKIHHMLSENLFMPGHFKVKS